MTRTARVAVARRFGPPTVITLEDHPLPPLPPQGVRVAVRANGQNPVDARRRAGTFGGQPPLLFGTEFAGVVLESNDPHWVPGDEVIGWGSMGAAADAVITDGSRIARKPAELSWEVAGGISGAGQTALTALGALGLSAGDTIVVHGASGGVGTALVQLARERGLRVIGTAGAANQDYLRELGAIPVIYGDGLAERIGAAADGHPIAASIDLAGTQEAGDIAVAVRKVGGKAITLVPETMSSHGLQLVQVRHSATQLAELLGAATSGKLVLPVEVLPLTEIVEAHRRMDAKHSRGKLVLDNSDNPLLP